MNPSDKPAALSDSAALVAIQRHNAVVGMGLFVVYLAAYVGFVYLATFSPGAMSQTPLWGLNLAILYGMGLIAGALVVALVYTLLCRAEPAAPAR
jgi:uncharacterized membrane protein (DUF485 family)